VSTTTRLYGTALDRVTAVVRAVPTDRWAAPTPCPDWSARRLLGHLLDGQHQVLAMVTGAVPRSPVTDPAELDALAGDAPVATWRRTAAETVATLAGVPPDTTVGTPLGSGTVAELLGIALVEPVVHGWDLAVATGQPAELDDEAVAALLPEVLALGRQLQASGMYRAAVDLPQDAPAADRLLAALGRDPHP
jgi:uncharacterized protein (TIGR03086 family)